MKTLVLLALLAADIDAPATAPPHTLVRAKCQSQGTGYAWFVSGPSGFAECQPYDNGRACVFTGAPGRYLVMVVVSDGGKLDQGQATVTIGGAPPPPPGPEPGPPDPGPVPDPDNKPPIRVDDLHVLITYESKTKESLPASQFFIIFGDKARDYLDEVCPEGRYRIWDDDQDVSAAPPAFREAMKLSPKKDKPWLLVAGKTKGYVGPLPANVEAFTKLIDSCRGK